MTDEKITVLVCAGLVLMLGGSLYLSGTKRKHLPPHLGRLALAWLLIALCPVFLIFLFFPESTVESGFAWGKATGAVAFFLVVWGLGIHYAVKAESLPATDNERNMSASSPTQDTDTALLTSGDVEQFKLVRAPKKRLALVPGGIDNVKFADVWVNSENTNMQMARFFDRSISGVTRYLGAKRNQQGDVTEDLIANELAEKLGSSLAVVSGTVLDTGPGELAGTHNVVRILHVAAVVGELNRGYAPVRDIAACASNALTHAEKLAAQGGDISSVVLPLFGAGTAKGSLSTIVSEVLHATVDYLERHPNGPIAVVYVLNFTQQERRLCRTALETDERLHALKPVARTALESHTT